MIELVRYHTFRQGYDSSVRVCFVKEGRKWLKVVAIDAGTSDGLRVRKVPMADKQYMKPLMRGKRPYSVKRALKVFRSVMKTHGATKGAKKLLKEVSREQNPTGGQDGKAN